MANPSLRTFLIAAVLALTTNGTQTRADLSITLNQMGSDVVATGSGSLDITDLTNAGSDPQSSFMFPAGDAIIEGPTATTAATDHTGISGRPSAAFGTGASVNPTSATGIQPFGIFGFEVPDPVLVLPSGYVTGTSLSSTVTYANQTFSSLGLTPGTYTWTWGTGAHADSLTVQIGPASAVTEPSTALVAVFGAVAFIACGWSRRRRDQRRQAAAA
jgi:hypothetical protein